jgi:hypothetical protein
MFATPRTVQRFLAAVVLSCSLAGSADAAIMTQTQNLPFTINLATQPMVWNQFNPALGTLLSVEYSVAGIMSGSFTVTNLQTNAPITAQNSQNAIRNQFTGAGAPAVFFGTTVSPVTTTPLTDALGTVIPFNLAGNYQEVFTLPGTQGLNVAATDLTASAAYFTGVGTVNSTIGQLPNVSVTGGVFQVDMAGLNTAGTATLTYRYDDGAAAVPEPSTVVFAGAGLVALAARRFRTKKAAKAALPAA